jgi:formiminoglutamase
MPSTSIPGRRRRARSPSWASAATRGSAATRAGREPRPDRPRLPSALASLALPEPLRALDAGDVEVAGAGEDVLEAGQERLGRAVAALVDRGHPVTVLGGGHEVAYGSHLGPARTRALREGGRLGVLNLDAHFDLRDDARPSSGTPFLQTARSEERQGRGLDHRVLGIGQPSNT